MDIKEDGITTKTDDLLEMNAVHSYMYASYRRNSCKVYGTIRKPTILKKLEIIFLKKINFIVIYF